MQEQPAQAELVAQAAVDLRLAVLVVAGHRVADVLGVHADLVGAPGFDAHLAIGMPAAAFQHPVAAQRGLALGIDLDVALAALAQAHVQRGVHAHHPVGHAPGQQGQVSLFDALGLDRRVLAQQGLQLAQGRALLRDHHQPGGVAVEPVHQLQLLAGPQGAQGLDHAEVHPAAAVAGHAGGLADRQQAGVLEHDAGRHGLQQPLGRGAFVSRLGETDRRHPHLVAGLEPGLGLGPAAVHPDLAAAHDLVDQRLGRAFQLRQQEVVEALAGALGVDGDDAHAAAGG